MFYKTDLLLSGT